MSYYLCRIRIDRAAVDEEQSKQEQIVLKESEIETERFYLRLIDEYKDDSDKSKYVLKDKFLQYLFHGSDLTAIKVKAVMDTLKAKEILEVDTTDVDVSNLPVCPICGKVHFSSNQEVIDNSEGLVQNINDHIKRCNTCQKYYCDGDGTTMSGEINGEETVYNVSHKQHFDESSDGHWPESVITNIATIIPDESILSGLSLVDKFKLYCFYLDSKELVEVTESLDTYLKENISDNTYLVYKYQTVEGGYVLRLKIEISPSTYFLSRENEFRSIGLLEKKLNAYFMYNSDPIYADLVFSKDGDLISKVDNNIFKIYEEDSGHIVIGIDSETENDFDITWERTGNVSYSKGVKNEADAGVSDVFTFTKEDFTETFSIPVYADVAGTGYINFSFNGLERQVVVNVEDRIFSDIQLGSDLFTLSKTTPVILTINLAREITHNQTVNLILPDVEGASFTPSGSTTLTFTPSDWSKAQRIQLTTTGLEKGTYELILRSVDNHGNNIDKIATVVYE